MKHVKGSMIKMIIKAIRADKSGAYDKILSDKAKELVAQRILDPVWYPFDTYKECFNALCQVAAKNDPNIIMQWGRNRGEELMTSIYRASIVNTNLRFAIESYARFHRSVFNFGDVLGTIISSNEIHIVYRDFEPDWDKFFYIATGWVQKFFELCLKKKISFTISKKSWEGADSFEISLSWPS